jgi:hypothetical protein
MNLRKKSTREEFERALAQCTPEDFDGHTEFTGSPRSSGSNGCVRQQPSFTSSKAKRILTFGTDRDNESKNGFKSRLFAFSCSCS